MSRKLDEDCIHTVIAVTKRLIAAGTLCPGDVFKVSDLLAQGVPAREAVNAVKWLRAQGVLEVERSSFGLVIHRVKDGPFVRHLQRQSKLIEDDIDELFKKFT